MRQLAQDVGNYVSSFLIMYLLSCLVLSMPFMVLGLVAGLVIQLAFGIVTPDVGPNVLGAPGIGMSMAYVAALPLAFIATLWAAPRESNIRRDRAQYQKKMGGPRVPRRPEEGAIET